MYIEVTKGARDDHIAVTRGDGSRTTTRFPKKGPFPHDLVHYVVESALGFKAGFWGLVAAGRQPEELAGMAREAGHASAKRAGVPNQDIVELLQAERLVECFEAEIWAEGRDGATDYDTLLATLRAACDQSHIPVPDLEPAVVADIRLELYRLREAWAALAVAESINLEWPQMEAT